MAKKSYINDCPRCGSHSFERLSNYAHCPHCMYFEDYYEDTETCYAAVRPIEKVHASSWRQKNKKENLETLDDVASEAS